jgi:hypothetical protein
LRTPCGRRNIIPLVKITAKQGLTMGSDSKDVPTGVPAPVDARDKGLAPVNPTKEVKTAEELAAMIREDLGNVDGCPKLGLTVTVYGLNPWNAMLTFGAAAGPVRNKAELQRFCEIITSRLQRLYDVAI